MPRRCLAPVLLLALTFATACSAKSAPAADKPADTPADKVTVPPPPPPPPPPVYTGTIDAARVDKARHAIQPFQPWTVAEPILLGIVGKPILVEEGNNYWGFSPDADHCTELVVQQTGDGKVGDVGSTANIDKSVTGMYAHCRKAAGTPLPEAPPPPPEDPNAPGPPKTGTVKFVDLEAGLAHAKSKWALAKVSVLGGFMTWSETNPKADPDGKIFTMVTMGSPDGQGDERLGCTVPKKDDAAEKLHDGDLIMFTGTLDDKGRYMDKDCTWKLVKAAPKKAKHH